MKITVLSGDGIGPEVTEQAIRSLSAVADFYGVAVEIDQHLIGGAAIREVGEPFPDVTRAACVESDAVLLGAVGDPDFDYLPPARRPEGGLLQLRRALGGFANLRPAASVPALIDSSPLRAEIFAGTDLLIVRELLGGIYFGEPRGVVENGSEAFNTMRYSVADIERVTRVAFEAARGRRGKLTSVDKANVLEVSQLWRKTVTRVGQDYPDVALEHLYVDACAMHLVTNPRSFDVILTENMFGDILSDEAAVLTGSLGMLPSATIGGKVDLYEPVHGSAPQIAGQGVANPIGAIASVAMFFRYTAKVPEASEAIQRAINATLGSGYRTADIALDSDQVVSTTEMGDRILDQTLQFVELSHSYHAV